MKRASSHAGYLDQFLAGNDSSQESPHASPSKPTRVPRSPGRGSARSDAGMASILRYATVSQHENVLELDVDNCNQQPEC